MQRLYLRRHYPDQVRGVDGEYGHPLSRAYPSSPLSNLSPIILAHGRRICQCQMRRQDVGQNGILLYSA